MQALSTPAVRPATARASRSAPRRSRPASPVLARSGQPPGVPGYGVPDYRIGNVDKQLGLEDPHDRAGRLEAAGGEGGVERKWWDYGVQRVGIPKVGIPQVTVPQYGPSGGDGNGGGRGGGGGGGGSGGGSGGGPMRGFTYLFAAALMAGGLTAFVRRGSYKSLLFSAAAAILLLIAASLMHRRVGTLLALGTSLVLAGAMGQRANSSGKVFPAGVVAIVSALMTLGYARALA